MSSAPRTRRGAHRTGRDLAAALVPSLLAVLAVSALVTALYVWRGQDADPQKAVASTGKVTTIASPKATASATPKKSTAAATAAATTTKTSPKPTATTTAAVDAGRLEVVVLNQSSRAGLAASAADRLRAKGWVVRTGNFRGSVPSTTVYYPPGAETQAKALAASLPTTPRVRERFGNLSTTRLTVVVTASYPG
jgi:LytR cell envelope-related transcriptional attenuator